MYSGKKQSLNVNTVLMELRGKGLVRRGERFYLGE